MPSRYFILPRVGSGTIDDAFRPKYMDDPRVNKYIGGEPIEKDGGWYFVCRVFVDIESDLDLLASQSDTIEFDLDSLAQAMNGVFPVNLTTREWGLVFTKILYPE